jgi:hypothetical protein
MTLVTFDIDNIFIEQIEKVSDNRSNFIREAIKDKLGRNEKSLQQLEAELETIIRNKEILEKDIQEKINKIQEQKASEKAELDRKEAEKQKKREEFMKTSEHLEQFDFIKNFAYIEGWSNLASLLPIIEQLKQNNERIGIVQLREYLTMRPHEDLI